MKIKKMIILAVVTLALTVSMFIGISGMNPAHVGAASNVYYYMPYLHTNPSNVVYCFLSNAATAEATVSVAVTSSSTKPVGTANTFTATLGAGITKMISFSSQSVTFGSESKDITTETGGTVNSVTAYGAKLSLASTGSDLNCKSMTMSCFQGTTNPKRNVLGYICEDDSTSGPGGNKNVLGF
ncbi:MAG: hypothetical protein H7844_05990 [Nitrospirae bacterium YQR-1]